MNKLELIELFQQRSDHFITQLWADSLMSELPAEEIIPILHKVLKIVINTFEENAIKQGYRDKLDL